MKTLLIAATILFSPGSFAKILNGSVEGKVHAYDTSTVRLNTGLHLVTLPRKSVEKKSLNAGELIQVQMPDGTLTELQSQLKVTYNIRNR